MILYVSAINDNTGEVKMKKQRLLNSFKNAIYGILKTIKMERNIKIHFMVMILVIISGFYFKINIVVNIVC